MQQYRAISYSESDSEFASGITLNSMEEIEVEREVLDKMVQSIGTGGEDVEKKKKEIKGKKKKKKKTEKKIKKNKDKQKKNKK